MLSIVASKKTNFTVNCERSLISSSLLEASAVGVLSLHWLHLQCNCSILSLPLYMFVVAVLTTLPSFCFKASRLLVVFSARDEFYWAFSRGVSVENLASEDFQPLVVVVVPCHLHCKLLVIH